MDPSMAGNAHSKEEGNVENDYHTIDLNPLTIVHDMEENYNNVLDQTFEHSRLQKTRKKSFFTQSAVHLQNSKNESKSWKSAFDFQKSQHDVQTTAELTKKFQDYALREQIHVLTGKCNTLEKENFELTDKNSEFYTVCKQHEISVQQLNNLIQNFQHLLDEHKAVNEMTKKDLEEKKIKIKKLKAKNSDLKKVLKEKDSSIKQWINHAAYIEKMYGISALRKTEQVTTDIAEINKKVIALEWKLSQLANDTNKLAVDLSEQRQVVQNSEEKKSTLPKMNSDLAEHSENNQNLNDKISKNLSCNTESFVKPVKLASKFQLTVDCIGYILQKQINKCTPQPMEQPSTKAKHNSKKKKRSRGNAKQSDVEPSKEEKGG